MSKQQINKKIEDSKDEYEVKMTFFDDQDTMQLSNLSSSVNQDYFAKGASSQRQIQQNQILDKFDRKLSDPTHKISLDYDDEQYDGFSEILSDPKALNQRQRLKNNFDLMAKSEIGFKVFTQEDDNNSNDLKSNSSLTASVHNLSSSVIASTGGSSKVDKILVNLEAHKIKVYDVNDFQQGIQCCVCKSKFGVFSLRIHHCRFCSLSCCQHCSDKRINSQRACNLCFIIIAVKTNSCKDDPFIASQKNYIEYQNKYLKLVEDQNLEIVNINVNSKIYSENIGTYLWNLQLKQKTTQKEHAEQLEEYGKKLRDIQYENSYQSQNVKNIKSILESKSSHLDEKKKALYQLQQQLKRQRDDNIMKQQALDTKLNKLNNLKQKIQKQSEQSHVDLNQIETQKGHSTIDPDSLIDTNHFSVQKKDMKASQSYYDIIRNSSIFQNDLPSTSTPSYEQQEKQQIEQQQQVVKRNYSVQSSMTQGFEPKTHNVAPKKENKANFCVNKHELK